MFPSHARLQIHPLEPRKRIHEDAGKIAQWLGALAYSGLVIITHMDAHNHP